MPQQNLDNDNSIDAHTYIYPNDIYEYQLPEIIYEINSYIAYKDIFYANVIPSDPIHGDEYETLQFERPIAPYIVE